MRICLVNPPNENELIGNDPVIVKEEGGCFPPIGLLSIAACLLQEGYEVKVIDAQAEGLSHQQVAEAVKAYAPQIVGVTVMSFTLIDCKMVIEEIRKRVKTLIVSGGPHLSIFRSGNLGEDVVIIGEGERAFVKLARDYPRVLPVYQETFIEDLDALPFPARHLVDSSRYHSILSSIQPITTAFSSRGCPYSCTFCDRPALGKRFRFQTATRVVDEMQECERLGIKEIFFYDDTFTISKKRVEQICAEYLRRNLRIRWDIRARVNTVDEEILRLLKRCNLSRIHFGVESAVPRVLEELAKGITPDQVYRAFDACRRLGIKTLAYFMLGTPTETIDDIRENLRMVKRLRADYMHMTIFSLFPGTKVYETAKKEGLVRGDPWKDYVENPVAGFRPPVWDSIYSVEEHEAHLRWFYKQFYLRPSYLWKSLCEIRSIEQFKRYFRAGRSLLRMGRIKIATDTTHRISQKATCAAV